MGAGGDALDVLIYDLWKLFFLYFRSPGCGFGHLVWAYSLVTTVSRRVGLNRPLFYHRRSRP